VDSSSVGQSQQTSATSVWVFTQKIICIESSGNEMPACNQPSLLQHPSIQPKKWPQKLINDEQPRSKNSIDMMKGKLAKSASLMCSYFVLV
jgi:hypothetical protein